MLRGIILGGVSGVAIAAIVGGVVSLSVPVEQPGPETANLPAVPETAAFNDARGDFPARLPAPISTPDRVDLVRPERPDTSDQLGLAAEALQSVDTPELSAPVSALPQTPDAPDTTPGTDLTRPAAQDPVYPSPLAVSPEPPMAEDTAAVDPTTPPPPRAAEGEEITGFPMGDLADTSDTPVAPDAGTAAPDAMAAPQMPADEAVADGTPAVDPEPREEPALAETEEETTAQPQVAAPVASPEAPLVAEPSGGNTGTSQPQMAKATADARPSPQRTPDTAPSAPTTLLETSPEPTAPRVAALPRVAPATPESDTEATSDTAPSSDADPAPEPRNLPGAPASRLIADSPDPTASVPEKSPEPATDTEDTRPPIEKFAQPFANPEGKPILAIVMIDDGTQADDPEATLPSAFPYPLSVAIPVTRPDAAEAMRDYRSKGYEVLALADLPTGATPQDLETSAQAWFSQMDQVVALMETPGAGLQAGREMGEQLAAILSRTGHGLLLYPDGLDTTRKLATRRDVPAATVFRDLDADGQAEAVIRRFLDNSAFKAGVEGAVILVTRLRPETLQALLVWGLADRASRVALAPVSAALRASAP